MLTLLVGTLSTADLLAQWWPNLLNMWLTNLPPGQNGRHFADNFLRWIFMNEKFYILMKILLKFVPKGPIDNSLALV